MGPMKKCFNMCFNEDIHVSVYKHNLISQYHTIPYTIFVYHYKHVNIGTFLCKMKSVWWMLHFVVVGWLEYKETIENAAVQQQFTHQVYGYIQDTCKDTHASYIGDVI